MELPKISYTFEGGKMKVSASFAIDQSVDASIVLSLDPVEILGEISKATSTPIDDEVYLALKALVK